MIDKDLLDILVCPKCKGELVYDEQKDILICSRCKLGYPIRDGIPIMLIDEAIKLAVKCLKKAQESRGETPRMRIAVIPMDTKRIRMLSDEEITNYMESVS